MTPLTQSETENSNNTSTSFAPNFIAGNIAGTAVGGVAPLAYAQAAGLNPLSKTVANKQLRLLSDKFKRCRTCYVQEGLNKQEPLKLLITMIVLLFLAQGINKT